MGYTRKKKKIVIINNEKKKQQQNVVLGSHHSLTHILWKHQKATKKKKLKKIQVRSFRICKPYLLYNIGNSSY